DRQCPASRGSGRPSVAVLRPLAARLRGVIPLCRRGGPAVGGGAAAAAASYHRPGGRFIDYSITRGTMFTGLVEEVGQIRDARALANGRAFQVGASAVLDGLAAGDSIAVDGVCLTVPALHENAFEVQAIATTLERTTLGEYREGRRVNLERAMKLGDRLGGHIVQGHVDGVGEVQAITPAGETVLINFTTPDEVASVTVLHGSIT